MIKKTDSKKLLVLAVIISFLFVGVLSLFLIRRSNNKSNTDSIEAKQKASEQNEVNMAKNLDNKNSNQGQQPAQSNSQASAPSINITSAMQQGDSVIINALVGGTTSGSCSLSMTNGNNKIQKSATIGFQVSYYICQGFVVNTSELVSKGDWTVVINVTSPNGASQSEPRKVNVK